MDYCLSIIATCISISDKLWGKLNSSLELLIIFGDDFRVKGTLHYPFN